MWGFYQEAHLLLMTDEGYEKYVKEASAEIRKKEMQKNTDSLQC